MLLMNHLPTAFSLTAILSILVGSAWLKAYLKGLLF